MQTVIYAVVDLILERCIYVGQTINLKSRQMAHKSKLRFGDRRVMFCQLRVCPVAEASRIEGQIIRAFKRRGEAECNFVDCPSPVRRSAAYFLNA